MKAILLSLVAAIGFGLAGPLAKIAFNKGLQANGLIYSYALCLMLLTFVGNGTQKGIGSVFPTTGSLVWGLVAGLVAAIGFKATSSALAIPDSMVSIVTVLSAAYPLISIAISIPLFDEKMIMTRFLPGSLMIIGGVYLVSTSTKLP